LGSLRLLSTGREGLGQNFLDEIENFYAVLLKNPFIHSFYLDSIRQGAIEHFPYVVVYEIFNETIVVYSVFMTKKNPSKKRIK